jgi:hypothetical protein
MANTMAIILIFCKQYSSVNVRKCRGFDERALTVKLPGFRSTLAWLPEPMSVPNWSDFADTSRDRQYPRNAYH